MASIAAIAAVVPDTPRNVSPSTAAAFACTAPEATQPAATTRAPTACAARPKRTPISAVGVRTPWRRTISHTRSPTAQHCSAPVSGADRMIHSEPAPATRNSPGPPTKVNADTAAAVPAIPTSHAPARCPAAK